MSQSSLFDASLADLLANHPGAVRATQPVTAHEAAIRVAPRVGSQKAKCLTALAAAGERGLTDYELSVAAGTSRPHVAGTRRAELLRLGLVQHTDRTRPTDTGSHALVYRITPAGAWLADELARAQS